MAYNEIEPIGDWLTDYRVGYIVSMMMNLWGRKKGQPPFNAKDFMLIWDKEETSPKKQSWHEMKEILMGIAKRSKKNPKFKSRKELNLKNKKNEHR
jgi:hypothetical protein